MESLLTVYLSLVGVIIFILTFAIIISEDFSELHKEELFILYVKILIFPIIFLYYFVAGGIEFITNRARNG